MIYLLRLTIYTEVSVLTVCSVTRYAAMNVYAQWQIYTVSAINGLQIPWSGLLYDRSVNEPFQRHRSIQTDILFIRHAKHIQSDLNLELCHGNKAVTTAELLALLTNVLLCITLLSATHLVWWQKAKSLSYRKSNPGRPARSLVTVLTRLIV